jgi:cell wall-associated NlpC family hydrolase
MALPSKLTSPLPTTGVDNPDVSAQVNVNLNKQTLTNPGATATIDPTQGAVIVINTTTAATTLALAATTQGTLQVGQECTVIITSSGATPTLLAGANVHLSGTLALTQNKAGVVKFVYDGTELKEIAATAALS